VDVSQTEIYPFLHVFGPLTSHQLSTALGITQVAVQRSLKSLERCGEAACMKEYNSRRLIWWTV
jgi:predicted transcriptional regulator